MYPMTLRDVQKLQVKVVENLGSIVRAIDKNSMIVSQICTDLSYLTIRPPSSRLLQTFDTSIQTRIKEEAESGKHNPKHLQYVKDRYMDELQTIDHMTTSVLLALTPIYKQIKFNPGIDHITGEENYLQQKLHHSEYFRSIAKGARHDPGSIYQYLEDTPQVAKYVLQSLPKGSTVCEAQRYNEIFCNFREIMQHWSELKTRAENLPASRN